VNNQDKFLTRLASGLGIVIAAWYWISTQTPYSYGKNILCDSNYVLAGFLMVIIIFYVMLVYAISRHIKIARTHHVHHTDEKMKQVNLGLAYYALLVEGVITSLILISTLVSLLWFGMECTQGIMGLSSIV